MTRPGYVSAPAGGPMRTGVVVVRRGWVAAVVALVLTLAALPLASSPEARPVNVLLLTGAARGTPALVAFEEAFRSTLRASIADPVVLHFESADLGSFATDQFERQFAELLRAKYARIPPDVIVVTHGRALGFVVQHRASLFPRAKIVFGGAHRGALGDVALGSDVTGVWLSVPWGRTLDAARRLQPGAKRVVVLGGTTPTDRIWMGDARSQLAQQAERLRIDYLPDLPIRDIERQVAALPDVLECHHVTGAFTLLLKVKTASTSTLERLIAQIRSMDGVARTETTVVLSTHVERVQLRLQKSHDDTVPPNHTRRARRSSGASGDSSGHLRRA